MGIPNKNPYVGPRPFEEEEWELFFGRKREEDDLLSLLLTSRLVLFYAPSGAGKSSLIRTRLCRGLRAEGFDVLPITRVSGELLSNTTNIDNIFVFNVLAHLDGDQHPPATLATISLPEYIRQLRPPPSAPDTTELTPLVLMIDQFEEIFTAHPEAWDKREDFFRQLNQAMNDCKSLWVLLALREEYVAALDPYARFLPGGLRTRFYMQSLSHTAALEAIEGPAQTCNRPFEPGVAKVLVDNLCMTWVRDHGARQYPGEFVEPVQLQVVCHQLWDELQRTPRPTISLADLQEVAGTTDLAHFVDTALARFYADGIRRTMIATGVPELDLRDWFDDQMITEAGTRNLVFRGTEKTGGLPNYAVDQLAANLLIRGEARVAGTWYELIHDRLIQPISNANLAWYQEHPLIMLAHEWDKAGRVTSKLLEGQRLQDALRSDWHSLGALVSEFLAVSQTAQTIREREQKAAATEVRQREQRLVLVLVSLLLLLAIGLGIWASISAVAAHTEAIKAANASSIAQAETVRATNAEQKTKISFARLLASEAQQAGIAKPQLGLLLAIQAVDLALPVNGRPVMTETLLSLQEALTTTASIPLRGQDNVVITTTNRITASLDGRWLAAGTKDGIVHIWHLAIGDPSVAETSLHTHVGAVTALAFSPDGHWLSTGGQDATVKLFALTAAPVAPVELFADPKNGAVTALAFYPTDQPTKTWLAIGRTAGVVQSIALSTENSPVVTNLLGNQSRGTTALGFSPDGKWLTTMSLTDTLRIWPLNATIPITNSRLLSESNNEALGFSVDGRWLATGGKQGTNVYLFDLTQSNGRPLVLPGNEQGVQSIGFSPDNQLLFVGSGNGIVRLWDLKKLEGFFVTSSGPRKPQLASLEPLIRLPAHTAAVLALAFQMDEGNRITITTAGADQTVKLWDMNDLQAPKRTLYGHEAAITSLFLGTKANLLFAGSSDGTSRVWPLDKQAAPEGLTPLMNELPKWETEACWRAGRDFTLDERMRYFGDTTISSVCAKFAVPSP